MGIPINIEQLINERIIESTRIEYKEGWNPNAIIHTICAFANDIDNTGGGYIIIGIEEENGMPIKNIKGVSKDNIDNILKELVGYCRLIEPLYNPIVEVVNYMGKDIIVIWAPGGHGRPYKCSKDVFLDKSNKKYYIRKFNSTMVASNNEEKDLFYISSNIPFDDRPNLIASIEDLDINLIRKHLYESESELYNLSFKMSLKEIASDMQLLSGTNENLRPKNVGLLFFNENPEKFFSYARIEVVDIPNPTGREMTEKYFTGPLSSQLKDALQYIKNYVIKTKIIKQDFKAESIKIVNYPFRTVEELLTNAVYHKSYQIHEPIVVRITPSEIEITSFPGLDRSITDENIKKYNLRSKIYRNRRIGDFLKELKLVEGRNTGYPSALEALKNNNSPLLKFEMDDERTYFSVIIPVNPLFDNCLKEDTKNNISKKMNREEIKKRVLEELRKESLSLIEIARELGKKYVSVTLTETIKSLEKEFLVIRKNRRGKIEITELGIKHLLG